MTVEELRERLNTFSPNYEVRTFDNEGEETNFIELLNDDDSQTVLIW